MIVALTDCQSKWTEFRGSSLEMKVSLFRRVADGECHWEYQLLRRATSTDLWSTVQTSTDWLSTNYTSTHLKSWSNVDCFLRSTRSQERQQQGRGEFRRRRWRQGKFWRGQPTSDADADANCCHCRCRRRIDSPPQAVDREHSSGQRIFV